MAPANGTTEQQPMPTLAAGAVSLGSLASHTHLSGCSLLLGLTVLRDTSDIHSILIFPVNVQGEGWAWGPLVDMSRFGSCLGTPLPGLHLLQGLPCAARSPSMSLCFFSLLLSFPICEMGLVALPQQAV